MNIKIHQNTSVCHRIPTPVIRMSDNEKSVLILLNWGDRSLNSQIIEETQFELASYKQEKVDSILRESLEKTNRYLVSSVNKFCYNTIIEMILFSYVSDQLYWCAGGQFSVNGLAQENVFERLGQIDPLPMCGFGLEMDPVFFSGSIKIAADQEIHVQYPYQRTSNMASELELASWTVSLLF